MVVLETSVLQYLSLLSQTLSTHSSLEEPWFEEFDDVGVIGGYVVMQNQWSTGPVTNNKYSEIYPPEYIMLRIHTWQGKRFH